MKKLISILLALTVVLTFAACGGNKNNNDVTPNNSTPQPDALLSGDSVDTGMKEKFDQLEYAAYQDLFYNKNTKSFENKTFKKDGTFAILRDAFNGIDRYYVWGYADNTKCCDYQWEFVMPEGATIPEPGSYIEVEGKMTKSDNALDGYWLTDASFTVKSEFKNAGYSYDMTTLSPTLVRVQIINMLQKPEEFKDATVRIFGRALSSNTIQHPYYNESWNLHFTETDIIPATGKYILLEGTYNANGAGSIVNTSKLTVLE